MKKVLRGYAKGKAGDLIQIGAIPAPHSKDKLSPEGTSQKKEIWSGEVQRYLRKKMISHSLACPERRSRFRDIVDDR